MNRTTIAPIYVPRSLRFAREITINVSDRFRLHLKPAGDRIQIVDDAWEQLSHDARIASREPGNFSQKRLGEIIAGLVQRVEA